MWAGLWWCNVFINYIVYYCRSIVLFWCTDILWMHYINRLLRLLFPLPISHFPFSTCTVLHVVSLMQWPASHNVLGITFISHEAVFIWKGAGSVSSFDIYMKGKASNHFSQDEASYASWPCILLVLCYRRQSTNESNEIVTGLTRLFITRL